MSHLIGRGQYKSETYPGRGASGGSGGSIVPLSRQRFIDGGTVQSGRDGSVARPFLTIAEFTASRPNGTVPDRRNNYVGWVTPAIDGYTGVISLPPNASTELRADSYSNPTLGTSVTGNVFWSNLALPETTGPVTAALHNVSVVGQVQITDVAESPISQFFFSADESLFLGAILSGGFVSNTTVQLSFASFLNVSVDNSIDAGTSVDSAAVLLQGSNVIGGIAARQLNCYNSVLAVATIEAREATFVDTSFESGTNPLLMVVIAPPIFDGPSWASFIRAGGTRSAATAVLVTGGYNGAEVAGAALTAASTSVALNGAGATAGFTGSNSGNHYSTADVTPTSVTLLTAGALPGDTLLITRTDLVASVLAVINGGPGAGTIGSIPTSHRGSVLARFNGTDWLFEAGGSLAA